MSLSGLRSNFPVGLLNIYGTVFVLVRGFLADFREFRDSIKCFNFVACSNIDEKYDKEMDGEAKSNVSHKSIKYNNII